MAKLTEKEKYKIVIVLNALTSIVGVLKLHNKVSFPLSHEQ